MSSSRVMPQEEVALYKERTASVPRPVSDPSYGIDSPAGLISSLAFAPLYLYATMKGKFDFWRKLLEDELIRNGGSPSDNPALDLSVPTLDAGCGRGLALIQTAKTRAQRAGAQGTGTASIAKSVGIDLFITADQTGNSVDATCDNLVAEGVDGITALYKGSFLELPFEDNTFGLVTSSLALHNPKTQDDRYKAVTELARVLKPGGTLLIFDLGGYVRHFRNHVKDTLKWPDAKMTWAGMGTNFGAWPTYVLRAKKPLV
ncbi:unnamed protein product [Parajaminaea phylloscopi]